MPRPAVICAPRIASTKRDADMITKRRLDALDRVIAKKQAEVAKVRDRLDDAIAEWEELREHCREAHDDLQSARDALSRLV